MFRSSDFTVPFFGSVRFISPFYVRETVTAAVGLYILSIKDIIQNMSGQLDTTPATDKGEPHEEPVTTYDSKTVMLRAERHDRIRIDNVITIISPGQPIPDELTVVKRTTAYFGPKLVLESAESNYLLTAPGPGSQLILWQTNEGPDGLRSAWEKLAEVTAKFEHDQPQYDLCPICGEPLKTLEHEREAAFGSCPNTDS